MRVWHLRCVRILSGCGGLWLSSLLLLPGCSATEPEAPFGGRDVHPVAIGDADEERLALSGDALPPGWSGGVTAVGTVHPWVPHGGLALPEVSSDGRWIAYLQQADQSAVPPPDAALTGRGLDGVTLWVRGVDGAARARPAALSGACWPAWSADGAALFFVTYEPGGSASLGRFDVVTGRVDRKTIGLRHLLNPVPSPDGARIAVITYDQNPRNMRVAIIDWSTAGLTFAPTTRESESPADSRLPREDVTTAQIMPTWADRRSLLYAQYSGRRNPSGAAGAARGREVALLRWQIDTDFSPTPVGRLQLPDHPADALMRQQGLLAHFDPAGGRWMYRDDSSRSRVIDLATQQEAVLPPGTATSAWWLSPWLVIGGDQAVAMYEARPASAASATAGPWLPVNLRLLDGRWAPRWVDPQARSVLLVGRGDRSDRLALYQLWIVVAED